MRTTLAAIAAALALLPAAFAQEGRMILRGQQQEITCYPSPGAGEDAPVVLFLPGDGGWRGDVIGMAKEAAQAGYRVYGWDVKTYLEGFTGPGTLSEADIVRDTGAVAKWITRGKPEKVILVGWSQGAAMAVLAAASEDRQQRYKGVIAIGLPERGLLGWKFADNFSYVTRKAPNEPSFAVAPVLPRIAPLPYVALNATHDQFVSPQAARTLFAAVAEPKRNFTIPADGHDFSGNRPGFNTALRQALEWIRQ